MAKRAAAKKMAKATGRPPESIQRIRDVLARPDAARPGAGGKGDADVAESFRTARISIDRVTRDLERLRRRARSLTGGTERPVS